MRIDEQHLTNFRAFALNEASIGDPDTHMTLASWLSQGLEHPAWFLGLYTMPYVAPAAEVLHHYLPAPRACSLEGGTRLWPLIVIRKERRVNGFGPRKLAESITGYATWLQSGGLQRANDAGSFAGSWKVLNELPNYGRYFTTKLHQALHRNGFLAHAMDDIRPRDADLSRRGLSWIFPDHDPKAKGASLQEANDLAAYLVQQVPGSSFFTIEAALCNYRQLVTGVRYPGSGHDHEAEYLGTLEDRNPDVQFRTWVARRACFNELYLSEIQDWGYRPSLKRCWPDYGYLWNDQTYDYSRTENLKKPWKR